MHYLNVSRSCQYCLGVGWVILYCVGGRSNLKSESTLGINRPQGLEIDGQLYSAHGVVVFRRRGAHTLVLEQPTTISIISTCSEPRTWGWSQSMVIFGSHVSSRPRSHLDLVYSIFNRCRPGFRIVPLDCPFNTFCT